MSSTQPEPACWKGPEPARLALLELQLGQSYDATMLGLDPIVVLFFPRFYDGQSLGFWVKILCQSFEILGLDSMKTRMIHCLPGFLGIFCGKRCRC